MLIMMRSFAESPHRMMNPKFGRTLNIGLVLIILFFAAAIRGQQTSVSKAQMDSSRRDAQTGPAQQGGSRARGRQTGAGISGPGEQAVRAAFEKLLDGIRHANVDEVMSVYWNSPQLIIFNNNGTVTKGWEQVRANRVSLYAEVKDVKLEVRDVRLRMLGPNAALVTCLWTQSQTFRGTPESSSGRLTLVFQRIGGEWKAVHAHTSPEAPDPSRLMPSERPSATPKAKS
jgi:ketosteroid isomerase-like protein